MNSESNRLNPSGWKQASQLRHHLQSQQIDSPESELSNFDCYQNYTAPEVFVQHIAGIVNQGDVEIIVRAQKQMYVVAIFINNLKKYRYLQFFRIYIISGCKDLRKRTKCF